MTLPTRRSTTSWQDDARGGMRSIGLEALVVVVLGLLAVVLSWIAVTVV